METRRWINASQPQMLQIAVILLYVTAALSLLFGGLLNGYVFAIAAMCVAAGYGIANERKWGYLLGVVATGLRVLLVLLFWNGGLLNLLLAGMLPVAMFALLVHPQSRDYQRIWFK